MTNLPVNKVLEGEIFGPNDSCYKVDYWRHYRKQVYEASTVEECVDFIYYGSGSGDLSYSGSTIKNMSDEVVMTNEQLEAALDKRYEEEE